MSVKYKFHFRGKDNTTVGTNKKQIFRYKEVFKILILHYHCNQLREITSVSLNY